MPDLISLNDIAKQVGVTPRTVRNWTLKPDRRGKQLRAEQIGKRWYTTMADWIDYSGLPDDETTEETVPDLLAKDACRAVMEM